MKKTFLANSFNVARLKLNSDKLRNYRNPEIMLQVLEEELGDSFPKLRQNLKNAQITVTPEQIKNYLSKYKNVTYDPASRQYFAKSVVAFRDKTQKLFDLIANIVNKNYTPIDGMLRDLDIRLDRYGYIPEVDAKRLVTPAIYNYSKMNSFMALGNSLSTYSYYRYPHEELARGNIDESQIYPHPDLQLNNMYNELLPGNIPLSVRQAKTINKLHLEKADDIGIIM